MEQRRARAGARASGGRRQFHRTYAATSAFVRSERVLHGNVLSHHPVLVSIRALSALLRAR